MCNGLLCCAEPHKDGSGPTSYFVCNPASGQTRTALVLEPQANLKLIAVNLAFDPLKSAFYNLIFVAEESLSLGSQKMIRIDIYSSETQSRRQVLNRNAPACNRRAHTQVDYFGQSGGRLLFVGVCRQLNTPFKVFELQQDRSGWFLKYESDCSTLIGRTRVCQFSVVTVLDSEREEDISIVVKVPGGVILYNVKKKTSRKLRDLLQGCPCNFWTWSYMRGKAYQWTETLASI
ncbi:F-box protein At5g07610-like [Malus sylvestris]|uniref:F-box protein At5g07610-like n=1 Tax=Malus sylvestris TaxID=3752 RepID=UPI0010AA931B|nr:F-box protein At5g07610-like [Malus domestica]XP_050117650.1 F-box protein At5g07610-like [Malus sylvestris]